MKKGMQNTGCKLWLISWLIQNRFPVSLTFFTCTNQSIYPVKSDIKLRQQIKNQ